jgi:hypothetical protein
MIGVTGISSQLRGHVESYSPVIGLMLHTISSSLADGDVAELAIGYFPCRLSFLLVE